MLDDTTLNLQSTTQEPFELSKRSNFQPAVEAKQLPLKIFCLWKVSNGNFSQFGLESQNNKPKDLTLSTKKTHGQYWIYSSIGFLLWEMSIKSHQAELAIYHPDERDTKRRKIPILLSPTAKPKKVKETEILNSYQPHHYKMKKERIFMK